MPFSKMRLYSFHPDLQSLKRKSRRLSALMKRRFFVIILAAEKVGTVMIG